MTEIPDDKPAVQRFYSKDYWDIVFEQLGKRALFKISIERYFIVQRFQNVMELRMTP